MWLHYRWLSSSNIMWFGWEQHLICYVSASAVRTCLFVLDLHVVFIETMI